MQELLEPFKLPGDGRYSVSWGPALAGATGSLEARMMPGATAACKHQGWWESGFAEACREPLVLCRPVWGLWWRQVLTSLCPRLPGCGGGWWELHESLPILNASSSVSVLCPGIVIAHLKSLPSVKVFSRVDSCLNWCFCGKEHWKFLCYHFVLSYFKGRVGTFFTFTCLVHIETSHTELLNTCLLNPIIVSICNKFHL